MRKSLVLFIYMLLVIGLINFNTDIQNNSSEVFKQKIKQSSALSNSIKNTSPKTHNLVNEVVMKREEPTDGLRINSSKDQLIQHLIYVNESKEPILINGFFDETKIETHNDFEETNQNSIDWFEYYVQILSEKKPY